MFREMRRKKQELSRMESVALLERATSGVLAVLGDGDYPYAVPLSFVYYDEKLYFHCAVTGHKLDAVKRHPKASFCVIGQDHVLPEKYTLRSGACACWRTRQKSCMRWSCWPRSIRLARPRAAGRRSTSSLTGCVCWNYPSSI